MSYKNKVSSNTITNQIAAKHNIALGLKVVKTS